MKISIFLLILVTGILIVYLVMKTEEAGLKDFEGYTQPDGSKNLVFQSPSPMPFEELTVPYLRNRSYHSSLGELQLYNENRNYSSFLTSYISDGLRINGLLTIPAGEQPPGGWPAVVFVHGYIPPTSYNTTENYIAYVDYLARNGFVVFKIDLRGHGKSEGQAGGAYYSSDYVVDVLNAYSALKDSDFVNADKVGIWGHSMAGNVTLRAFVAQQNIPAVSIWAGAVYTYKDFAKLGIQDGSYRPPTNQTERQRKREQLRLLYGEPDDGNAFWELVAPTNYFDGVSGAIQLNHSVDDDVVDIEYSRGLDRILENTSIFHEFNEYNSGGHNIEDPSFAPAMENTVKFFKKYLDS